MVVYRYLRKIRNKKSLKKSEIKSNELIECSFALQNSAIRGKLLYLLLYTCKWSTTHSKSGIPRIPLPVRAFSIVLACVASVVAMESMALNFLAAFTCLARGFSNRSVPLSWSIEPLISPSRISPTTSCSVS